MILRFRLAILFLLIHTTHSAAQTDTIYFDHAWEKVSVKDSAEFFSLKPVYIPDSGFLIKDYYLSTGNVQMEALYSDSTRDNKNGYCIWYYENGNMSARSNYSNGYEDGFYIGYYESGNKESEYFLVNGIREGRWREYWDEKDRLLAQGNMLNGFPDGEIISYYQNGNIERKEIYKERHLFIAKCYTIDGKDTTCFEKIDRSIPRFPGGDHKYDAYVCKHRKYPKHCKERGIEGKVFVLAYFDETGKIYATYLTRKAHPLLDNEALRIIKGMPKWEPALSKSGVPVKSERELDIFFEL